MILYLFWMKAMENMSDLIIKKKFLRINYVLIPSTSWWFQ
jgi:hypothetical protein